ncbi:hypothetical protein BC834DRAFT_828029 [Gloeopeniophorella convolvens]|nr:hypothetical protein BC834DRAFT_828029 [Gloeopeniophorella convolvens]
MVKGGVKSSASSATRKKHARKAVKDAPPASDAPPLPKEKKAKGKARGKEPPRKKEYIPPRRPPPAQPDPLDTHGLAQRLPAPLLVVLRALGKKDALTRAKALDELRASWLAGAQLLRDDDAGTDPDADARLAALKLMLPVWLHHASALFLHPARRLRTLALSAHAEILRAPALRAALFSHLREAAPPAQLEALLGAWCMAARDAERPVALVARRSWDAHVALALAPVLGPDVPEDDDPARPLVLDAPRAAALLAFAQRALLDPAALHAALNPVQVSVDMAVPRTVRGRPVPAAVASASASARRVEEESAARRTEAEEESKTDRNARLRIGALGRCSGCSMRARRNSKRRSDMLEILSDARVWSALYHAPNCPFADVESFGHAQPVVRSYAWTLLQTLVENWIGAADRRLVPMLSVAVLRSSFVEPSVQVRGAMWRPWLKFLKEFPRAWEIDAAFELPKADESESDAEESGSDAEDEAKASPAPAAPETKPVRSPAFADFLQFLELGCAGSPLEGYPAVLIILSTIPSSILLHSDAAPDLPAAPFFASFWAAVDGRALSALERAAKSAAFLSALLECTAFVVRRVRADGARDAGVESALVRAQYARVWEECAARRLRVEEGAAGELVAKSLARLSEIDEGLFDAAWDALAPAMRGHLDSAEAANAQLVFSWLKAFRALFAEGSRPRGVAEELFEQVTQGVLARGQDAFSARSQGEGAGRALDVLLEVIDAFGDALFSGVDRAKALDDMVVGHAGQLLTVSPKLLTTYLSRRGDDQVTLGLWRSLLASLLSQPIYTALPALLDAAERGTLPDHLKPAQQEFDRAISAMFSDAMGRAKPDALPLLLRVIRSSGACAQALHGPRRRLTWRKGYFVTDQSFDTLLQQVVATFSEVLTSILHGEDGADAATLDVLVQVIAACVESRPAAALDGALAPALLPDVFDAAFLLPQALQTPGAPVAEKLWTSWRVSAPADLQKRVDAAISARLQDAIFHTSILASPRDILRAAADGGLGADAADALLPTRAHLDELLRTLRADPAAPSLAILQPLVPPAGAFDAAHGPDCEADRDGRGAYARGVGALLLADRAGARARLWALRHVLALAAYAEEMLAVPALPSPAFTREVPREVLRDVVARARGLTAYLLTPAAEESWHADAVAALLGGRPAGGLGELAAFTVDLVRCAQEEDDNLHARILHTVLQHALRDATQEDADQWVLLARKLEEECPETALAIVLGVAQSGTEPPRLARYRNELAAGVLGVPPRKAPTDGLLLLRRLAATAPDPDSDVAFLPQARAVNLLRACQEWVAADEDVGEDVESELTGVCVHLVPILQNVPGAHWELMFDLIESNLEVQLVVRGRRTLTVLWRTVRLILAIQDQAAYNKALRADWKERETAVLTLLRDIVASEPKSAPASEPRAVCREAALSIVQNLPQSLMDHTTLSKASMSHLLFDPSANVQKMAYELLREAAHKRTEHLVIEAGVDTEEIVKSLLPLELVSLLQQSLDAVDVEEDPGSVGRTFGSLLSWMIVFDLYTNASMKVKSGYSEHLQELGLVETHLIPLLLNLLQLYGGPSKPVKLDVWSIDEYFLESYDPENPLSARLLAAHVYYRALLTVPSLVRAWLFDCKDKNLAAAVTSYTAAHFSPVLIDAAFAHLRGAAETELAAENLAVRVAGAVHEVTAAYNVDEHQLEITLKVPPEWPLQRIAVKDSRRVGVPENRWRGWLLGVQQIVWSQNGSLVDALSLFKKNVTLHFEGQTECAICYSIISVSDGSLPRKPCKTCKNRFHASCLYKWFNTSHSSSCPLCRSEFM